MNTQKILFSIIFLFITCSPIVAQVNSPDIPESDLSKFSQIFEELRALDEQIQCDMIEIVSHEKMNIERFNQLYQKDLDPAQEINLTKEEKIKYDHIVNEIEKLQVSFQRDVENTIKKAGLTVEKYQEIATRLQIDSNLQERLRRAIKN